jgi:ATP-dependent DNA ligase
LIFCGAICADLRPLPLHERRRRLQEILQTASLSISLPLSIEGRGHALFDLMRQHDLEMQGIK